MAVIMTAGFETGDISELDGNDGTTTPVVTTPTPYAGTFALSVPLSANYVYLNGGMNLTTLYVQTALRIGITTLPPSTTGEVFVLYANDNVDGRRWSVTLQVTPAGVLTLDLREGPGSTLIGSPVSISANTWYLLDVKSIISVTGTLEMRLAGSVVATGSANLGTTGNNYVIGGSPFAATNGLVATAYYDAVIMDDAAYPVTGPPIYTQVGYRWRAATGSLYAPP